MKFLEERSQTINTAEKPTVKIDRNDKYYQMNEYSFMMSIIYTPLLKCLIDYKKYKFHLSIFKKNEFELHPRQ